MLRCAMAAAGANVRFANEAVSEAEKQFLEALQHLDAAINLRNSDAVKAVLAPNVRLHAGALTRLLS